MPCHKECVYNDPEEGGGPVCTAVPPAPMSGWLANDTLKEVVLDATSICVKCDHFAGCHRGNRPSDGPIDPERFPKEHDWVGPEGKGKKCKAKDAAGKPCGARWGWHYWPWDSRGG